MSATPRKKRRPRRNQQRRNHVAKPSKLVLDRQERSRQQLKNHPLNQEAIQRGDQQRKKQHLDELNRENEERRSKLSPRQRRRQSDIVEIRRLG